MNSLFQIRNIRYFIAFRIFFNTRFYYPVFTILFIDFGLTIDQFAILNTVWAATIVILEVPSGALADIIGRRNLLIFASLLMIFEMGVICMAPVGGGSQLFLLFLINRILSGAAEAAASGADEALAYDSLKAEGDEKDWQQVLSTQMKLQSACFIIAMIVGAFVYDPSALSAAARIMGIDWSFSQNVTVKFPIYLTFAMSILALFTTLRMQETTDGNSRETDPSAKSVYEAFRVTLNAGKWIFQTPIAIMLILSGLFFDHIVRMLITLESQYFRTINLPEASFGVIGSGIAALGMFTPQIAAKLVQKKSMRYNFILLGILSFLGIYGTSLFIPYFGIAPVAVLFTVMMLNNFFLSQYLNEITPSAQRATVLSFKGLAFNLAYGFICILYAISIEQIRHPNGMGGIPNKLHENEIFTISIGLFPWYFLGGLTILIVIGMMKLRVRK